MGAREPHYDSTLVQVMAWCHQATNRPLPEPVLTQIHCMSRNGITRPQRVKGHLFWALWIKISYKIHLKLQFMLISVPEKQLVWFTAKDSDIVISHLKERKKLLYMNFCGVLLQMDQLFLLFEYGAYACITLKSYWNIFHEKSYWKYC